MSADVLDRVVSDLIAGGEFLRSCGSRRLIATVTNAWEILADPERSLGRRARVELPESSGLSEEMVVWALSKSVGAVSVASVEALAEAMRPPPGYVVAPARLGLLYLAGNVFSACVQPWTVAILSQTPMLVKASSRDDVLPRLFELALSEVDPQVASAYRVVTLSDAERAVLTEQVVARTDWFSAFGSDRTITQLRAKVPGSVHFVPHGHGLGVGILPAAAPDLRSELKGFALDVAAYDQRGCMSPHVLIVERRESETGGEIARLLCDELDGLATSLPRGPLPTESGAAQMQWRGVGQAKGELRTGDRCAVSFERDSAIRLSPGYRNVQVIEVHSLERALALLPPLGNYLKVIGVGGDTAARRSVAERLPVSISGRICALGQMQLPPLDALADGRPPWEGLLKYRGLE